jgi:ATP-dependent protease Clp ATPase subunit
MYEIPGAKNIKGCKVTKEVILENQRPTLVYSEPTAVKSKKSEEDDDQEIA